MSKSKGFHVNYCFYSVVNGKWKSCQSKRSTQHALTVKQVFMVPTNYAHPSYQRSTFHWLNLKAVGKESWKTRYHHYSKAIRSHLSCSFCKAALNAMRITSRSTRCVMLYLGLFELRTPALNKFI